MLMIILSHYCYHGGINLNMLPLGFNKIILQLGYLGNLGVNIFFLISSYFMYEKKSEKKKLFKLLFEIFSYSIIIYCAFVFCGQEKFNLISFIKNFFPILFKTYWFATIYIIIYIFSPYLNILIKNLSKKEHLTIGLLLILLWSLLPTFLKIDLYSNYFTDVIILYFIATYIKKYNKELLKYLNKIKAMTLILGGLLIVITISFNYNSVLINFLPNFYTRNSFIMILISSGLFISFLNKEYYSKFINIISSCTFGVYLLHDNYLIRNCLWKFVENEKFKFSPYLLIHMIFWCIVIFITCIIIEFIRKNTIQKFVNKHIDFFCEKIDKSKLEEKLINSIKFKLKQKNPHI